MDPISKEDRKRLFSMFQNMDLQKKPVPRELNSDVLLIDGLNCFFRAFMAVPSMNENGLHVGGIAGFLQSLGYASKLLNPTRIVVVFDGSGGSMKRRKIFPEYKEKRKTNLKYNRAYEELTSEEQEDKNIQVQLLRLVGYLDALPLTVMSVDHVEADDTIAYAATDFFKNSNKVYIMSTDKDYLQLVNERINVWNPSKKKMYGCAEILLEYGISCENFLNYRILSGDESDNIDGIYGSGIKTVLKCFPQFAESRELSLNEIYSICEENKKKYKLYNTILENKNIMERNRQLMQLKDTQLQSFTQLRVNEILKKPVVALNRLRFGQLLSEDRMWGNIPNHHTWLTDVFGRLILS